MEKKAFIIVGLGYGDEGKGLSTDFLCCNLDDPLVIRFNGGHQAGHTVTTKSGESHVFSNFGAGSLRGVPTYWSSYCTFSPSYLIAELTEFQSCPKLYIDQFCPVTTHYDILYNRLIETSRGISRLGTCGAGFGATIDRHYTDQLRLYTMDLTKPTVLKRKITEIRKYYKFKIENETEFNFFDFNHTSEDDLFHSYVESINFLFSNKDIVLTSEKEIFTNQMWRNYIFEGAQGILLDKQFGNSPYITKSNTTTKNAMALIKRNFNKQRIEPEIFYVSRTYSTRHGYGPFVEFDENTYIKNTTEETNEYNEYQGNFRKGFLNLNLLHYAIICDSHFSRSCRKNLILTCVDQLLDENIKYWSGQSLMQTHYKQLPLLLNCTFHNTYFSFRPYSDALEYRD